MIIEKYFGIDRETVQQLIAETVNMIHEKKGDNRFQNTKVFLFDEYAVHKSQNINVRNVDTQDPDLRYFESLANTLLQLRVQGVNVVPVLAVYCDDGNGYVIQTRAKGAELYDRHKANDKMYVLERVKLLSNAPQEHFDKFVADTMKIVDTGVIVDFMGKDNFFYDERIGFQFIDLDAHFDYVYGLTEVKPNTEQFAAWNCFAPCYFDTVPKHRDTVSKVFIEMTDNERLLLCERNKIIFEKCKTALLDNRIPAEMISEIIVDERFIPQKQKLGLHMGGGVMNWWNKRSDEYYSNIKNGLDIILENAKHAFPAAVWNMINREFPDLRGKRVLVPSSGDNIAVFGFTLLGASVTSCDIAEQQLSNAKKIADVYGWNINFIRQDSMTLDGISDGEYDLVYTSNGVHVWISDLPKMYGNFRRVLKPEGKYIMFETHPFIRPFDNSGAEIKVKKPYTDIGPYVSEQKTGTLTEFGWRIMDLFNAVFNARLQITHMEEIHSEPRDYDNWFYDSFEEAQADNLKKHDWKQNPWAALPQWISFTAKKGGAIE